FFGQNIVFMVLVVLLAADVASRLARRWRWMVGALLALVLIAPVGEVGSWGYHNFMQHDVGTIKAQAKVACATQTTPGDSVLVGVYPSIDLHVRLPRAQLCTAEVAAYQPDYVTFGLQPGTDPYLGLNSPMTVQQVFVAPRDGLAGVSVYLSTFMRHWTSPYRLTLYREDCRTVVRQTDLPPLISDNRYLDVHFAPVTDSASRRYCFDLKPTTIPADALAAWMTPPDSYPAGQLLLNGQPDPRTLVFSLLYPNVN
ncbi:MAG TPA: hypothetical protein VLF67_02785, partial [Candidatus Saccharimonas sp.]|nr:hypothetical protein [Candidatus Saccharimonas sp.]